MTKRFGTPAPKISKNEQIMTPEESERWKVPQSTLDEMEKMEQEQKLARWHGRNFCLD